MHIYEGILAATPGGREVLLAGAAAALAGTAIGLWKLDYDRIPRTAVLSAAFFVASAIQVPLPPTSVHLLLGGLMGLVLGWSTFPAVLIALLLQAVLFSIGGLTSLGVNTVTMALPGVICGGVFRAAALSSRRPVVFAAGAAAGVTAVLLGGGLVAAALALAGQPMRTPAAALLVAHLPIAVVEGLVTGSVVVLLRTVRPEVLGASPLVRVALFLVVLVVLPRPALAHKLNVFAQAEGPTIHGRAYFSGGSPAIKIQVTALDAAGHELGRATTDQKGNFSLEAHRRCDYRLVAETGDGHGAEYTVSAAELPAVLPRGDPALAVSVGQPPGPPGASSPFRPMTEGQAAMAAGGDGRVAAELQALERQVGRLREQLDENENRLRFRDLVGGIGYILGLAGIACYCWTLTQRRAGRP